MEVFIIGQLYWHKYPYDDWENEYYYCYASGTWKAFPMDKHGRMGHMLLFLGFCDIQQYEYQKNDDKEKYGDFIFEDKKIAVKIGNLCMVDLSDKWVRKLIRKYGNKK